MDIHKGKILVVMYSFEGNTKLLANKIVELTKGDLLELKPVNELESKGFTKYIWGGKQAVLKKKPKLRDYSLNLEDYTTIYLGTPIWASTFAPPIRTFITEERIENKNLAFFFSHAGGGIKKCVKELEILLPNNKILGSIDLVNPLSKEKDDVYLKLEKWVKDL